MGEFEDDPVHVPQRLETRLGIPSSWPEPVLGAFAAVEAPNAVAAFPCLAAEMLLDLMSIPGTLGLAQRYGRLRLVGIAARDFIATPVDGITPAAARRELWRAPLDDVQVERRGLLLWKVRIAQRRVFVPRRQARDLEQLLGCDAL